MMDVNRKIILGLVITNFIALICISIYIFVDDFGQVFMLASILFFGAGVFGVVYAIYSRIKGGFLLRSLSAPLISLIFFMLYVAMAVNNCSGSDCGLGILALILYFGFLLGIFILVLIINLIIGWVLKVRK